MTTAIKTDTLLASRELLGYPGCRIELHVDGQWNRVNIIDPSGSTEWKTVSRMIAKDWFFHPFVYGYKVPNLGGDEA